MSTMKTVGETLVDMLEQHGVEFVFGIPGVHTVELYRGLAASPIRHITPRHEQGAGFMADGYARISGKPGVALVITGPGLTNTITAMAQARQDSIPMLVISGVNRRDSLGKGWGFLHELPDQHAMMKTVALASFTLLEPNDLEDVLYQAFAAMTSGRPGPVHIEIPTDVMKARIETTRRQKPAASVPLPVDPSLAVEAARLLSSAKRPVILCGGGAIAAEAGLRQLAEAIDAPVITTINARGMLAGHPLLVPASPSLAEVRALLAGSDLVLAVGTEMGQTDYDMNADGGFPPLQNLVRIDVDADQLARGPQTALSICASSGSAVTAILSHKPLRKPGDGANRAAAARDAVLASLSSKIRTEINIVHEIYAALPAAIIVGDSTQAVYAGNLYVEAPEPRSWFNAATGFGALGYAPPAAIGAAIAAPSHPVICLVGDGGIQFSLGELGSAVDAGANVIFLVWNNDGYQEIESYMLNAGIKPEGVKPLAPDFLLVAEAYGIPATRLASVDGLAPALLAAASRKGPSLIEIHQTKTHGATA